MTRIRCHDPSQSPGEGVASALTSSTPLLFWLRGQFGLRFDHGTAVSRLHKVESVPSSGPGLTASADACARRNRRRFTTENHIC
ncbi:hypothetical protein PISMIDRAFT_679092, partial [Pisolithus microcarpus 441]